MVSEAFVSLSRDVILLRLQDEYIGASNPFEKENVSAAFPAFIWSLVDWQFQPVC